MNTCARHTLSGLAIAFVAGLAIAEVTACGGTNDNVKATDGGARDTGTHDAAKRSDARSGDGGPRGPIAFHPSNLGSLLATLDLSKLIDIDVTSSDNVLSVSCGGVPNSGCVEATVMQSDGSTAAVYVAKSWKVEPSALLRITDTTPVIIVATTTISILGHVDASATSQFTHAGGYEPASPGPGAGGAGVGGNQTTAGVGGGGAGFCGLGGAGGLATATTGAGGKTYGSAKLIPLMGGSAGGLGGLAAGAGGGAVELVAGASIDVGGGGVVSVGGGGGDKGDTSSAANGAGSGGALLLEAPVVTIDGTLAANGGGGGGGSLVSPESDATPDGTAAPGGSPGTTGVGGAGSAGTTTAGGAGAAGDPVGGTNGPGAGGGGSGWIRINTTSGVATLKGTLSPAAGSTCLTQGVLAK